MHARRVVRHVLRHSSHTSESNISSERIYIMKDKNATAEKRLSYTPLSVIALLFALAAGSLEAVLMLRYFEPYITASTGEELFCFFSVDTVLPTVLYIVSAAAAAIIVIFGFIAQRRAPVVAHRAVGIHRTCMRLCACCGDCIFRARHVPLRHASAL